MAFLLLLLGKFVFAWLLLGIDCTYALLLAILSSLRRQLVSSITILWILRKSLKMPKDKTGRDMLFIRVEPLLCTTVLATSKLYLNQFKMKSPLKTAGRR